MHHQPSPYHNKAVDCDGDDGLREQHEVPPTLQMPYIYRHYRFHWPLYRLARSVCMLHNQTGNIWCVSHSQPMRTVMWQDPTAARVLTQGSGHTHIHMCMYTHTRISICTHTDTLVYTSTCTHTQFTWEYSHARECAVTPERSTLSRPSQHLPCGSLSVWDRPTPHTSHDKLSS